MTADGSPTGPVPSLNALADSLFIKNTATDETGLSAEEAAADNASTSDAGLPLSQDTSEVMVAAHAVVDEQLEATLETLDLAELQAVKTRIIMREKQLLTTVPVDELFAPMHTGTHQTPQPATAIPSSESNQTPPDRLSLLEYAKIREEHSNLETVNSTRVTADLVQSYRDKKFLIPGPSGKTNSLAAAMSYVAAALHLTKACVDRRVTAASTLWPTKSYRRTKLKTPKLAAHLERGRLSLSAVSTAQDKLADMRQAVRRAGGEDSTADDLVRHKEGEFVHHAVRNNPHTFGRYAKAEADAITNELIGPRQKLTEEQIKREKGIFYAGPIGDCLHRLELVVDDKDLLVFTALREFATKLDSEVSRLRALAHRGQEGPNTGVAVSSTGVSNTADDEPSNCRLSAEDIDMGIAQLFDGQTRAERWLNTAMDFISSGLLLHKTYDPKATPADRHRRGVALEQAAEHSAVLTDILATQAEHKPPESPKTVAKQASGREPLMELIPEGYQLWRPNLDMIVAISLPDLIGAKPTDDLLKGGASTHSPPLVEVVERLKTQRNGKLMPTGSPGSVHLDISSVRQLACDQRIIPMVLGTASQPLDVGRAQRSFPHAIRRALHVRDRGCVVPGCPRPREWCQPHHLQDWAKGGQTSLENAALLCRHHHAAVHKKLINIHMEADGLPSCSLPVSLDPSQTRYRNVYWRS